MSDDEMMEEASDVDFVNKRSQPSDDVAEEEGFRGREEDVDLVLKKIRKESSTDIKQMYPLIRDHFDKDRKNMSLYYEFVFDPPQIAKLLAFTVYQRKQEIEKLTCKIMTRFGEGHLEEAEKCTEEFSNMITEDPRLGDLLEKDFLEFLVNILRVKQHPKLQFHVILILKPVVAYSNKKEVVIQYITSSIIVNLMRSEDCELQVQALWLLRTIGLAIPNCPKIKTMLEEALEPVTSFFIDGSPDDKVLCNTGSMTLAAICQVHPKLPAHKLKLALCALKKLVQYESEDVLSYACSTFAYLCDGREEMVVEHDYFDQLIDRLIAVIDSDSRPNAIGGITALGSIVRWGSDSNIQVVIDKDGLSCLEYLLVHEEDKYLVMDACWILSNITARKRHIQDVIRFKCIDSLVGVVQNYKLLEVKKEAAWAILNAIHGSSTDQINVSEETFEACRVTLSTRGQSGGYQIRALISI